MQYLVRTAGILGEAIPLAIVAFTIARSRTPIQGTIPFNRATYKVFYDKECARLLHDAEAGMLRVCDDNSHLATPEEIYAKADVPPTDGDPGRITHLYTRIAYLNAWSSQHGDSFLLDPVPDSWIESFTYKAPQIPESSQPSELRRAIIWHRRRLANTQDAPVANNKEKPWETAATGDPEPEYPWYTAARYFARELVRKDHTLAGKMSVLVPKVNAELKAHGYKKRGKKDFADITVRKSLLKVKLK